MKTIGKASSLQWALDQLSDPPRHPDEFTVADAFAQSNGVSETVIRHKLLEMARAGILDSRMMSINGRRTKLYRRKEAKI